MADTSRTFPVSTGETLAKSYLDDPTASWAVGVYGALAEFHRDLDEAADVTLTDIGGTAVTNRGALAITLTPDTRVVAYEWSSKRPTVWNHGIAFCHPRNSERAAPAVLRELGPDTDAPRPEDQTAILFDLGLGGGHADICVRTSDAAIIAALRQGTGRPFMAHENPALGPVLEASPHRVFRSALGRVEVYGPIPSPEEKTPETGPHTHILPDLLKHGRTHSANIPIPDGWVPGLSLYPANPVLDASGDQRPFDEEAHIAFLEILESFGEPARAALKGRVVNAISDGAPPIDALKLDRWDRHMVRVTLRQLAARGVSSEALKPWQSAFEPSFKGAE